MRTRMHRHKRIHIRMRRHRVRAAGARRRLGIYSRRSDIGGPYRRRRRRRAASAWAHSVIPGGAHRIEERRGSAAVAGKSRECRRLIMMARTARAASSGDRTGVIRMMIEQAVSRRSSAVPSVTATASAIRHINPPVHSLSRNRRSHTPRLPHLPYCHRIILFSEESLFHRVSDAHMNFRPGCSKRHTVR